MVTIIVFIGAIAFILNQTRKISGRSRKVKIATPVFLITFTIAAFFSTYGFVAFLIAPVIPTETMDVPGTSGAYTIEMPHAPSTMAATVASVGAGYFSVFLMCLASIYLSRKLSRGFVEEEA